MGPLEGLAYGFSVALLPSNLLACFIGVLVGTVVGVLPGIGPVGAMALLLPSTFAMHPATALIMLAGIYYGAMYGGSTTSILVNVPGEAGSVVTLLDGYQMTRKGRAGAALTIAAVGSFFAGTVGVVGIMLAASWLADVAIRFGPPEYFAITLGGILLLSRLSGGSMLNAFVMVALGLALGTVGMDSISALRRFTFGSVQLAQGIELVPVIMGVYGVAEVLLLAEEGIAKTQIASVKLRELLPTSEEWRRSTMPIARGSVVGFLTGLVPGPARRAVDVHLVHRRKENVEDAREVRHRHDRGRGGARSRQQRRPPPARWCRSCRSASPSRPRRPSCSAPWSSTACSRGRS